MTAVAGKAVVVTGVIPGVDALGLEGGGAVLFLCPHCGEYADMLTSDVDGSVAFMCEAHGCIVEVRP